MSNQTDLPCTTINVAEDDVTFAFALYRSRVPEDVEVNECDLIRSVPDYRLWHVIAITDGWLYLRPYKSAGV